MFSIIKKLFLWIDFETVTMRKIYCTRYKIYKAFKKPKILYIDDKTLLLSNEKYLKRKNQLRFKNCSFNWKYIITLKIWVKNLDYEI